MNSDKKKHIKPLRLNGLPEAMRRDLKAARLQHQWSQSELGQRIGLPQTHISGIETGKIVPRFDTVLDLVRVLSYDLLMVPRPLVPAVQALIRDQNPDRDTDERPLYADDDESEIQGQRHDER
jgi:transcriptional regulator with XRE-family HTH domain